MNTHWKCIKHNEHCNARCNTIDGAIASQSGSHNNAPEPADLIKRERINDLKESAKSTQNLPCQLVAQVTHNMPKSVAGIFPRPRQLTQTIQRTRKAISAAPPNPESLVTLVIPDLYTKSAADEDFLLFDSGPAADRILLFSTHANLQALSQSEHWYADGTFKCCPTLFSQLFTIHGVR